MVVSNTSPLTALTEIGLLSLIPQLYGTITLPGAVFDEITVAGAGAPGADEIREAGWVTTLRLDDTPLVRALKLELDAGEAEAIACAVQLGADWLLSLVGACFRGMPNGKLSMALVRTAGPG